MNKKEIIKVILLILFIVGIAIFSIYKYKTEQEEIFLYSEEVLQFNTINSENEIILEEVIEPLIKVYVTGEVNFPGVKEIREGSRIEDVINSGGGLTNQADISGVNLAYEVSDGQKIYIPKQGENQVEYVTEENEVGIIESENKESNNVVNINKASISELTELPGVGEALAKRIVDYREENGKFQKVEDLKKVSGIGDKKYENLKEYIDIK